MNTTIKEVPVRVFQRKLICECGGEMEWTGATKPMHPPLYIHKCTNENCRKEEYVKAGRYPRTRYEEIESEDT